MGFGVVRHLVHTVPCKMSHLEDTCISKISFDSSTHCLLLHVATLCIVVRPNNGTYYPIRVLYNVADVPNCNPLDDIKLRCRITGVVSAGGEPQDLFAVFPPGAGNPTGNEYPQVVMLRAKKVASTDTPRRYTINSECFDEQGNRVTTSKPLAAAVQVPKSCRGNDKTCQDAADALKATVYPAGTSGTWLPTGPSANLALSSEP